MVILSASGCDTPTQALTAVEEHLKDNASTERKTGTLRALEVASSAHAIAKHAAAPIDARCRLELPAKGAYTYRVSLEVQRKSVAGVESRWSETRTLRRDEDGDLAATMDAAFRTELGDEGQRSPQWRLVGRDSYVSDDGRAFYRQKASAHERKRRIDSASATFQMLLDAVSTGWSSDGSDSESPAVFIIGGERLVCGPSTPGERGLTFDAGLPFDAGWLRRFETRATPLNGRLWVPDERSRKLEVRWQLEDGSTLEARFEDRLEDGADAVEAPTESSIVAVERDRSLGQVEQLIERMTRRGLIEDGANHDSEKVEP